MPRDGALAKLKPYRCVEVNRTYPRDLSLPEAALRLNGIVAGKGAALPPFLGGMEGELAEGQT